MLVSYRTVYFEKVYTILYTFTHACITSQVPVGVIAIIIVVLATECQQQQQQRPYADVIGGQSQIQLIASDNIVNNIPSEWDRQTDEQTDG